MKIQLLASFSLAALLFSCGDDKGSNPSDSSAVQLSSGVPLSSGVTPSSSIPLSSGVVPSSGSVIGSSSSAAEGAIPGLAIVDSAGSWWVRGLINGTEAPSQITGQFLLDGAVVSGVDMVLGTAISAYVIKPNVNVLSIPLSGPLSLETKVEWGSACAGTYQLIVTAVAGATTIKDTTDYLYEYGDVCN